MQVRYAIALITANQVSPLDNQALLVINDAQKFCAEFSTVLTKFNFDTACNLLENSNPYICGIYFT